MGVGGRGNLCEKKVGGRGASVQRSKCRKDSLEQVGGGAWQGEGGTVNNGRIPHTSTWSQTFVDEKQR